MTMRGNTMSATVDKFVEIGKENSVQFQNSSYFQEIDGQILEEYNIFRDRYYAKLMSYTEPYTFKDNEEFQQFKYRPKALSAILYNSIDYWYILLIINKMYSCMDFTKRKIRIITQEGIKFIRFILMKEEKDIRQNKKQVSRDMEEYELVASKK